MNSVSGFVLRVCQFEGLDWCLTGTEVDKAVPLPSWGQSSYRVLNDVLCSLKFSEGDPVLRMAGCVRERRNGCCFNLVFGIMVSKVTVKQDCGYGGREAGVITWERFPSGRNAVQRPCGRCGGRWQEGWRTEG